MPYIDNRQFEEPESDKCPECNYTIINGECHNCQFWDQYEKEQRLENIAKEIRLNHPRATEIIITTIEGEQYKF